MDALSFGDSNLASEKTEDDFKAKDKLIVRIDDYPAELCPFSDSDDDISGDIQNGHTGNAVQARLHPISGPESDGIRRDFEFGSGQTGNIYPAGLCPFSDTEDDHIEEKISVQKIVKENDYPAGLCPFSDTDDDPCEKEEISVKKEEISVKKFVKEDYPEQLNPFAENAGKIQKMKLSFGKKRRAPQPPASHWDPDGYMVLFCRGQEE